MLNQLVAGVNGLTSKLRSSDVSTQISDYEKFRQTVKGQVEAEADGGYAAGDGPYYDSDVLAALLEVVDVATTGHKGWRPNTQGNIRFRSDVVEALKRGGFLE